MIPKIKKITPLDDYTLDVVFEDGKQVLYDVKEDIETLPAYRLLAEEAGLFEQVQIDLSRTCVFWSDEIDLPSDMIYEYGEEK
ncbi:MAG: DUF2442 domain-containing protein [Firmicutes bacterium]|nr:DUF2442 domain-containing protein [Bacillota bacterium]